MKQALSIHIPTPCHEDWDKMTTVDKGRFCQSCAKQVVDFSLMSDQQVLNYLSTASGSTCGRFANDQLQRPLQPVKQEKKKLWWMAAMMPLLMLFEKAGAQKKDYKAKPVENIIKLESQNLLTGDVVIVQSNASGFENNLDNETNFSNYRNKKIKVERKKGDPHFTISGKVTDDKNKPVPFAIVAIKGTKVATSANGDGHFELKGIAKENWAVLTVNDIGFEDAEVYVQLKDTGIAVTPKKSINNIIKASPARLNAVAVSQTIDIATSQVNVVTLQEIKSNDINQSTQNLRGDTSNWHQHIMIGGYAVCYKVNPIDTIPTLIRKVFHAEQFKIFPNPAQRGSSISIDVKKAGAYSIQLFNNNGTLVDAKNFEAIEGATQTFINIPSSLAAGAYYIRVVDNMKKKQYTDKIVVM